ncbi:hypothetical protein Bca4012_049194 [Brassica carinata]|uniref:Knottin scorpion toxin-like domain-containing protein n=2 Tax=Brassica TaxID=3705 RepID=A0A3P6DRU7_BRAOL|nr:hypothetical protein HID58_046523 [Brassica napus]CAF1898594.1 unnamed protein product [Brassica napus]CAF2378912.1 unnamed protein product [Brassica napus]VDD21829.1 unnamed protein product [Brassica oleracea]
MNITVKTLVAFVFTFFFIISCAHSHTTAAIIPDQMDVQCFNGTETCDRGGNRGCTIFCKDHDYFYGLCTTDACCCHIQNKNMGSR